MILRKKYTIYIKPLTNVTLVNAAQKSKCSKGKIVELLVEKNLTDNLKILIEEAIYHEKEMHKRQEKIKKIKNMEKEELDKKKKLKL